MTVILLIVIITLLIVNLFLILFKKANNSDEIKSEIAKWFVEFSKFDHLIRSEFSINREEAFKSSRETREELANSFKTFGEALTKNITDLSALQKDQFGNFSEQLQALTKNNEDRIEKLILSNEKKQSEFTEQLIMSSKTTKEELVTSLKSNEEKTDKLLVSFDQKTKDLNDQLNTSAKENREEQVKSLKSFEEKFTQNVKDFNEVQIQKFNELITKQEQLKSDTELKLEKIRETVEQKLQTLQDENGKKLEEMRNTVDEKLQATVEKRFDASFKIISDRLELVHKGLGEMQTLAIGVGDLKKVLTNVKTRGNFGEIQLGAILEQILSPEQFEHNKIVKSGTQERVEYVVKLPGQNEDNSPLYLPIDSKFPNEDYQRLLEVYENVGTIEAKDIETINRQFENAIKKNAKDISDKYINPPNTTDFAIMFVPTEGLYAEILRRTGLFEKLQRDFKIIVVGPTNLVAFLSSLNMGFRTLAIQKRSSEVWQILGAVKTEFGKFGDILDKTKKKLQEATNTIDSAGTRSRAIERHLKKVELLPQTEAVELIGEALNVDIEEILEEAKDNSFSEKD
ncbi:DNA recombination protein RmuC [Flavobacterium aquidurense]|uniref:DNA recombination protein RmuC n=1 Tax=Flavobacterium aquidurense TaxID=362413 RepID=UPI003757BD03